MQENFWFKVKLETYNSDQHEVLSDASELFRKLMSKTRFQSAEEYASNRSYLLHMQKAYQMNKSLALLINELLLTMEFEYQQHICDMQSAPLVGGYRLEEKYLQNLNEKELSYTELSTRDIQTKSMEKNRNEKV